MDLLPHHNVSTPSLVFLAVVEDSVPLTDSYKFLVLADFLPIRWEDASLTVEIWEEWEWFACLSVDSGYF